MGEPFTAKICQKVVTHHMTSEKIANFQQIEKTCLCLTLSKILLKSSERFFFNHYLTWLFYPWQIKECNWLVHSARSVLKVSIVGNETKGQISKRRQWGNKTCQIFWKANISYPPPPLIVTHTCAYQVCKNVRFSKKWFALIFCYLRFEIRCYYSIPQNSLCFCRASRLSCSQSVTAKCPPYK